MMSIRLKIILIVLPLIVSTLILTGISSFFSATNAVSAVAREFLGFKAEGLQNQAESQWGLLVDNNLTDRREMVAAAQAAVAGYAGSIIRSPTECIIAFGPEGRIEMSTSAVSLLPAEIPEVRDLVSTRSTDFLSLRLGGMDRVAEGFWFEPFQWYLLITEERGTFYDRVNEITFRTVVILLCSLTTAVVLILLFAGYLMRPLTRVVAAMKNIISANDLSQRVVVEYRDEIGTLAQTFNLMAGELDKAYGQIKGFAFRAVLARKREQKIRHIFQKYVPKDVIERFFQNPESMLVGENRVLSILFSDIRSFTTISEGMSPDALVDALNRYFSVMVDIIMARGGIVDKYIGDAIMAIFGAPVKHPDDALQSVLTGIEMGEALVGFNRSQEAAGRPSFRIGVGINYGEVTVGNIGTEKKMDYTVIGDMVNLASRLEGLTKMYHQGLIISESLQSAVAGALPCRLLDSVAVKGKTRGVRIYTVKKALEEPEDKAWAFHNAAMEEYYHLNFAKAAELFGNVRVLMPDDYVSGMLMERCRVYETNPPPSDWDGVEIMKSK